MDNRYIFNFREDDGDISEDTYEIGKNLGESEMDDDDDDHGGRPYIEGMETNKI